MKIGVQLNPQVSIAKSPESLMPTLIEQVRVADQSGFHAFSMGEHYNIPALQRVHQIPALARLCAEVKHCEVGTAVMLLGLRHPVTVANELATLDVINNGRSFAAFGLGYRDEELNAFNLNKAQRFQRFVEGIEIIKKLWTEDHVSFYGKEFRIKDVTVDPKPLQKPRPPIWIAANSDLAVERAARIGDDWIIGPHSAIEELESWYCFKPESKDDKVARQSFDRAKVLSAYGNRPHFPASSPATPILREAPKIGRNDLCPCGSGKKYKKCCGKPGVS